MEFELTDNIIRRMCEVNNFEARKNEMVFFGLRGTLPDNVEDYQFGTEHKVVLTDINYINPRCTLGQWLTKEKEFAIFPGSTIPHRDYISKSVQKGGEGANQLMTGYYSDYRKGVHKAGGPTGHDAFRQVNSHPVQRTSDDLDFDNDDRVEYENPNDNIHAGWCMGVNSTNYASAGCQVLVGYPQCEKRGSQPATGPWKIFKKNAYDLVQKSFGYILLDGREVYRIASAGNSKVSARLRFGSQGELVKKLQKALQTKSFYEGNIDGDFGERTLRAVLNFQTSSFGPNADDGIVGPQTAAVLKISWPEL
ncbi:MAG: peptidoglycan-binding protein [Ignavibacteriaceae bacterium]|nr:peptidoglycan-binding protein [Ignavibacteriaceae bacterium]